MTGLIDLTYGHDGRWYVLDYKSNQLPAYDAAAMQQAMAHSEYDLQALIYTLALHRWLRFRLGDAYDYARDFGGIRYLFCRGLDLTQPRSPGVHAQRFAPELVQALGTERLHDHHAVKTLVHCRRQCTQFVLCSVVVLVDSSLIPNVQQQQDRNYRNSN